MKTINVLTFFWVPGLVALLYSSGFCWCMEAEYPAQGYLTPAVTLSFTTLVVFAIGNWFLWLEVALAMSAATNRSLQEI